MLSTIAGRMFGDVETPNYEVISKTDVYEERKYAAAKWAVTKVEGKKYKDSSSEGFMKLFKYITGTNETGKKVSMTAPVCFFCQPGDDDWNTMKQVYNVGFLLPKKNVDDPPKPKDDDITFRNTPEATMYVRKFGGYAGEKEIIQEIQKLRAALSEDQYKDGCFYFCGYDPPMKPVGRTNEVWLIKV
ncbi:heme-binding protein 1-like [Lytechinus variegatus]|uniref:heme-binding protein 1-like n=1 Tax=Lytechinus variegatus TaxID=7654 RepID=UPI001BB0F996|nr:heme-binding protein 1-like [Lytechinus variegatus]